MRGHGETIAQQLRQVLPVLLTRNLAHEHRLHRASAESLTLLITEPARAQQLRAAVLRDGHAADRFLEVLDQKPKTCADWTTTGEHDAAPVAKSIIRADRLLVRGSLIEHEPIELADWREGLVAAHTACRQFNDALGGNGLADVGRYRRLQLVRVLWDASTETSRASWICRPIETCGQQAGFRLTPGHRGIQSLFEPLDLAHQPLMVRIGALLE